MKIDWSSEGVISWDEFCTYMQLEYAEKEDSYLRSKEVSFHLPAKIQNPQHKNPILKITDTQDGTFIACSQVNMNVMYISVGFTFCPMPLDFIPHLHDLYYKWYT